MCSHPLRESLFMFLRGGVLGARPRSLEKNTPGRLVLHNITKHTSSPESGPRRLITCFALSQLQHSLRDHSSLLPGVLCQHQEPQPGAIAHKAPTIAHTSSMIWSNLGHTHTADGVPEQRIRRGGEEERRGPGNGSSWTTAKAFHTGWKQSTTGSQGTGAYGPQDLRLEMFARVILDTRGEGAGPRGSPRGWRREEATDT